MGRRLPQHHLLSRARYGEFFVWQLGVYASSTSDVRLTSCSLKRASWRAQLGDSPAGARSSNAAALSALSTASTWRPRYQGRPRRMQPWVRRGCARSLWFGVRLPAAPPRGSDEIGQIRRGRRRARFAIEIGLRREAAREVGRDRRDRREWTEVSTEVGAEVSSKVSSEVSSEISSEVMNVRLVVSGPPLADQGDSRSWRLSRLRWLDSTLGTSPAVPYPFTPVTAHFTPAQSATHAVGSAVTAEADREAVGRGASVDGGWSSRLLANLGMSNLGPT